MRKRALIVLSAFAAPLLLASCGGGAELSVIISTSRALGSWDKIDLVVFGANTHCGALVADPVQAVAAPYCVAGVPEDDCVVAKGELDRSTDSLVLFVPEGTRTLLGVGWDSDGEMVSVGCRGSLAVEAGESMEVSLRLE